MEVWIVFWVLCGIVSAVVASSRGASGFLGFVLGVLLGPLGIVIAFVLKPSATLPTTPTSSDGTFIKCAHCQGFTPSESRCCMNCGTALA